MRAHEPNSSNTERADHRLRRVTTERDLRPATLPLPNYALAEVCPACDAQVYRHACKVRCARCGFMWDCSEL